MTIGYASNARARRRTPRSGLFTGVSVFASLSVLAYVSPAFAQAAGPTQASDNSPASTVGEVVVTGTRIGGVAPVGTALVQLDQNKIQDTGLTSTADILNTIPSILQLGSGNAYSGGQAQQGSTLNSFAYGKSPNIRGFGVGATLSLVNGHRMPYEGANMVEFDGDNYPAQMIQRIDIVQDGGSALYGADAIAGTVNYILRTPANALEIYSGYGTNDGQDTWFATAILGKTWNAGDDAHKGGFIASYQHSYQTAFRASARPDLYNDDLSPYGGPPSPLYGAPGNVVVGNTYYSIPGGQDGESLTLSQLGTTPNRLNTWTGVDAIPQIKADRVALNANQNVTDWLQLFVDGLYVKRSVEIRQSASSNYVTNFGFLPQIPNSNPFSPCNPGHYPGGVVTGPANLVAACGAGSLAVAYNDVYDIGAPMRLATTTTWEFGGGAKVSLPYDWNLTLAAYSGEYSEPSITTDVGGAPQPNFATFNFFCDPTHFACTDPATAAAINATALSLNNRSRYSYRDYSANATGKLFAVPAGEVRVAIGAERYEASLLNQNNFGANNLDSRAVSSVYGELFVPIVSPDFALPGVNKLEFDVSGRYDNYSDAGVTKNPKIGFNWWPVEDLKIFASYGTSFRAPGLGDNDPYSQYGTNFVAIAGSQISSALCAACQGPGLANATIYQAIGGANRDLKPETSKTYSFGADWKPSGIPGLAASVNYWWTSYDGQINTPAYNVGAVGAINQGIYNSQIIFNPSLFPSLAANNPTAFFGDYATVNRANPFCAAVFGQRVTTQAAYDNMVQCLNSNGQGTLFGPPSDPSKVIAVESGHRINAGSTVGRGLDFSANYTFGTQLGRWRIGAVGEYVLSWRVATISGAPLVEEVNRFGYPLRFKARGQFGWDQDYEFGRLGANLFVNYDGAYKMDLGQLPVGVPASYANIGSYTTVDLTLRYATGPSPKWSIAKNLEITLSLQNLLDASPPLAINQSGLAGSALRFDPTYGSPLGRSIQVQLGKRF